MYKKLRYGLIALLAFVGLTASAQGVVFDFDNDYATLFPDLGLSDGSGSDAGDINKDITSTAISGFTITVSAKEEEATNPNRLWNGTNHLRVYSGTITVSGSGIESIEFTWGKNNITTKTGELKGNVWSGNANTVVFTVLGNTQISKIVINGNAVAPTETEEDLNHGTEDDPISVSEAIYAAGVVGNAESKEDFYVVGTISSIVADKNTGTPYTYSYKGNATYYIKDALGNEFEIYQGKYFSGVSFAEGMTDIEEGDVVVVCGKIMNFGGHTPEFVKDKSHLVLLNGKGYEEPGPVIPTIQNITVEDFLAEPTSNDTWYRLIGMVTDLKDGNAFGNFNLKDKTGFVYVYGVLSEEGGDSGLFQELVERYGIKNGGIITIVGNRGKQNGNPAMKNAYFEDYEAGSDPETFEVNVADALDAASDLFENEKSFDYYQVTGYVVGEPSYERKEEGNTLYGNVNLTIADTKDGTNPLEIFRANSLENAAFTEETLDLFNEGDLVTFYGKLQNFVKTDKETGVSTQQYELVEGYLVKASASLEMPASGLATFCSPYPIEIEDQNVYIVTQVGKDKALVQKVEAGIIESGTGLLVEGSGTVNIAYAYGEKGNALSENMLVGTLKEKSIAEGEAYILKDGAFHLSNAGTFPARKAYLPVDAASGAKIFIDFSGTTAINEVKAQNENIEIYTIGGIRVKNAQQKGVYIINGKKVVK
ncbi:MAG: hypothetical protein IK148_04850 [Prevotella sp.]|nr:hypothetical protein [Prevotella sp.]